MTDRTALKHGFLEENGWGDGRLFPLAGDASNRRYERATDRANQRAVLMDADPAKGEDTRPFIEMAQHLTGLGLSAPEIFAADPENGFLLLEDLGDALFARRMAADPSCERALYEAAVDVLTYLHTTPAPALPVADAATLSAMTAPAFDWYLPGTSGSTDADGKAALESHFHTLLLPLDVGPKVLALRDYHAENLIWLPDRKGVARTGLLDFQDAVLAHPAYDLVSLLQDARRDVSATTESDLIAYFIANSTVNAEDFRIAYAVLGAQRALRILGIFARLCLRDGKPSYPALLPRVWGHLQKNLRHPVLAPVASIVNAKLPAPDDALVKNLRARCATRPVP